MVGIDNWVREEPSLRLAWAPLTLADEKYSAQPLEAGSNQTLRKRTSSKNENCSSSSQYSTDAIRCYICPLSVRLLGGYVLTIQVRQTMNLEALKND